MSSFPVALLILLGFLIPGTWQARRAFNALSFRLDGAQPLVVVLAKAAVEVAARLVADVVQQLRRVGTA